MPSFVSTQAGAADFACIGPLGLWHSRSEQNLNAAEMWRCQRFRMLRLILLGGIATIQKARRVVLQRG